MKKETYTTCSHTWIPKYLFQNVEWYIPALIVLECEDCNKLHAVMGEDINTYG